MAVVKEGWSKREWIIGSEGCWDCVESRRTSIRGQWVAIDSQSFWREVQEEVEMMDSSFSEADMVALGVVMLRAAPDVLEGARTTRGRGGKSGDIVK